MRPTGPTQSRIDRLQRRFRTVSGRRWDGLRRQVTPAALARRDQTPAACSDAARIAASPPASPVLYFLKYIV
jgi:hypothetical protein